MAACILLGLVTTPAIHNVLSLLVDTLSLPESGGLIVIGSLFISGAVFLRLRRSTRRKRAR
jgi:hypothetical protein